MAYDNYAGSDALSADELRQLIVRAVDGDAAARQRLNDGRDIRVSWLSEHDGDGGTRVAVETLVISALVPKRDRDNYRPRVATRWVWMDRDVHVATESGRASRTELRERILARLPWLYVGEREHFALSAAE